MQVDEASAFQRDQNEFEAITSSVPSCHTINEEAFTAQQRVLTMLDEFEKGLDKSMSADDLRRLFHGCTGNLGYGDRPIPYYKRGADCNCTDPGILPHYSFEVGAVERLSKVLDIHTVLKLTSDIIRRHQKEVQPLSTDEYYPERRLRHHAAGVALRFL